MRYEKGRSGNPGGRPRADGEIRELARKRTMTALLALIEIAERGENKGVCVTAANAILDRGCGKPAVPVVAADLPPMITLDFGTTLRPPQRDNDSGEQTFLDRTAIQDAGSARRLPVIPPSSDS